MRDSVPSAEELASAIPVDVTSEESFQSQLIAAAKNYFAVMYKIHDIENHVSCRVTGTDTRSAGWSGHGELQPGIGLQRLTEALRDRAVNTEDYRGAEGMRLQHDMIDKARDNEAFRSLLSETVLLTLYEKDLQSKDPAEIEAKNAEVREEQKLLGKEAPKEIVLTNVSLKHILAKRQSEVAQEMGVELTPVSRVLG